MSRIFRLPILLLLVFFCWAAPGWAAPEDFCGAGIHPAHQGCACHSESLCACHSGDQESTLAPALRETLPVVLPFLAAYAGETPCLEECRLELGRPLAPVSWSEPPGLRPPRSKLAHPSCSTRARG